MTNDWINGNIRQISCVEEFQIICWNSALKEREHNFPLLKCGLCIVTSFQRVPCGKRFRVILLWRNLTNATSARWPCVISTVISHTDRIYLWYCDIIKHIYLVFIPSSWYRTSKSPYNFLSDRGRRNIWLFIISPFQAWVYANKVTLGGGALVARGANHAFRGLELLGPPSNLQGGERG